MFETEMMMSQTNDTSKLDRATIEKRVLADSELDAVTGGWLPSGIPQNERSSIKMTMSKSNDISRPAALDDHCPLADSELDAVTGGRIFTKHPAGVTMPDLKLTMSDAAPV
jgi:hypothetical protein